MNVDSSKDGSRNTSPLHRSSPWVMSGDSLRTCIVSEYARLAAVPVKEIRRDIRIKPVVWMRESKGEIIRRATALDLPWRVLQRCSKIVEMMPKNVITIDIPV